VTVKIYSGSNTSGSLVQTLTATASAGSWSIAPTTPLADATYTAQAQQSNTNGTTGYSLANTFTVDTTPPTNSLSLVNKSAGGSYLSGSTLYYQGSTAGSFKLQNALSDSGSGPASSAFAALGGTTTGWSFTSSTASTPAGGPYVSNTLSWTAGTTSAPSETVTGSDYAGNTAQTTLTFANDSTAPTGSIGYTNGATNSTPITVSFSASDGGSGVNSSSGQLQRASAPLSNGSCGTFGAFANVGPAGVTSPYSDSSASSGNCYEYRYLVSDRVGNQVTIGPSGVLEFDTTPPTQSLSLTAATSAYLSGTTLYWNGNNTSTGGFELIDAVTDSGSGPASANFPAVGATGWTHANETVSSGTGSAPTIDYTSSAYSWGSSVLNPANQTITGSDAAGNPVTTTLHFVDDTTPPSGGSVDVTGLVGTGSRYSTSTTLSIAFSKGTDSQSGVAATGAQLERASATLSSTDGEANGSCGPYGSYTLLATDPASPYADNAAGGIQAGHCYKYEYIVSDNVGNTTTYTSGDVKVQTTAPASLTPVPSLSSATGNTFISGSTVYTNPQSGNSGGFTLSSTASDATSGIADAVFPSLGAGYSGGGTVSYPGPYSTTYSWSGATATASGLETVSAADNATLTGSASFTVTPDTTPPTGSITYTNGDNHTGMVSVSFSATDSGSGVNSSSGQLQRASATLSNGGCGAFSAFANVGSAGVSSPYSDSSVSSGNCYEYRYLVSDNVGNQATITSTSIVKVDLSPPSNSLSLVSQSGGGSYLSGTTLYYQGSVAGSFKLQNAVSDPDSGPASSTFAALGATATGWSFTGTTVSTPSAGPYASNAFSWTAGTSSAPTETVTGSDNAGNTTQTTLTLTNDSTAPATSVSFPASGAGYDATSWDAGCATSGICGTASDSGSGVKQVLVSIQEGSGDYWNGASFGSASEDKLAASGTTSWALPFSASNFPASGSYTVRAYGIDNVGNTSPVTTATFTFSVGAVPVVSLTQANGTTVSFPYYTNRNVTAIGGGCTSGDGNVTPYVNGTAGTSVSCTSGSWTAPVSLSSQGTYTLSATQADSAGTGSSGNETLVIDTTAPTTTTAFPAADAAYNAAGWDSGCATGGICGTASDSGSGVKQVLVSIQEGSGDYWNGSSFGSVSEDTLAASGTTSWSFPFSASSFPSDGSFTVRVYATDDAGNTSSPSSVTFTIDTTAPATALTFPSAGAAYSAASWDAGCATSGICGTASDSGSGVKQVVVSIQEGSGDYWNGSSFGSASEDKLAASGTTSWSFPFSAGSFPSDGSYTVRVYGTDNAGNTSSPSSATFTIDTTAPTVSLTKINGSVVAFPYSTTQHVASIGGGCGTAPGDSGMVRWSVTGATSESGLASCSAGSWELTLPAILATQGGYTLTAAQTDKAGNVGSSGNETLTIGDLAPVASFTFSPSAPLVGQVVSFDGSPSSDLDGTVTSYSWIFGDGSGPAGGVTVTHTYAKPGNYTVQLSVTDNSGSVAATTRTVAVSSPSAPPLPVLRLRIPKQLLGSVLSHGLAITVSSNRTTRATVELVLSRSDAKQLGLGNGRRPVVIASLTRRLVAGG
jgi:PKD domain-containing protein/Big-like domain-containing protein